MIDLLLQTMKTNKEFLDFYSELNNNFNKTKLKDYLKKVEEFNGREKMLLVQVLKSKSYRD